MTGFIRVCRQARVDLAGINRELADLKMVLELLKDDSDVENHNVIPPGIQAQILGIIESCMAAIMNVETVLKRHSGRAGAARWAIDGKKEAASLKISLEAYRGALGLALETVTLSLVKDVKKDTNDIKQDTADIQAETSEIRQDTRQILDEIARLRELLPDGDDKTDVNIVLGRYFDTLTSYAETVADESLHSPIPNVEEDCNPPPLIHDDVEDSLYDQAGSEARFYENAYGPEQAWVETSYHLPSIDVIPMQARPGSAQTHLSNDRLDDQLRPGSDPYLYGAHMTGSESLVAHHHSEDHVEPVRAPEVERSSPSAKRSRKQAALLDGYGIPTLDRFPRGFDNHSTKNSRLKSQSRAHLDDTRKFFQYLHAVTFPSEPHQYLTPELVSPPSPTTRLPRRKVHWRALRDQNLNYREEGDDIVFDKLLDDMEMHSITYLSKTYRDLE